MEGVTTFARRLSAARKAIGVSQKQLGIMAGVDEFVASARINQYERGKHLPDALMAKRLACVLKVPISYLYEPNDDLAALLKVAARLPKTRLRALIKNLDDGQIES